MSGINQGKVEIKLIYPIEIMTPHMICEVNNCILDYHI